RRLEADRRHVDQLERSGALGERRWLVRRSRLAGGRTGLTGRAGRAGLDLGGAALILVGPACGDQQAKPADGAPHGSTISTLVPKLQLAQRPMLALQADET